MAYVSGEFDPNNVRGQVCVHDFSNGTSETVFVGDWLIQSLQFSSDGTTLGFVEDIDENNLTLVDIHQKKSSVVVSGVSSHEWCWSSDGQSIFFVRNGLELCQIDVSTRSVSVLFRGEDLDSKYPCFLVTSPDGKRIGFDYDWAFHSLDLSTLQVDKWFKCQHYFIGFDWGEEGVCYLDAAGEETKKKASLMIWNPATSLSREVSVGPFGHVSWLREGVLLVRKNNTELWEITTGGEYKQLFPVASHLDQP